MSSVVKKAICPVRSQSVTRWEWLTSLCLVVSDCAALSIAYVSSLAVFFIWHQQPNSLAFQLLPALSVIPVFTVLGLYPVVGLSPVQEFRRVLVGSTFSYGMSVTVSALRVDLKPPVFAAFIFAWASTVLLVLVCRAVVRNGCGNRPWWGTPTVIFGSGDAIHTVLQTVENHPSLGLKVVAIFATGYLDQTELSRYDIHVGASHHAPAFAEAFGITHAIIASPEVRASDMEKLIGSHAKTFKHLLVIPEIAGISSVWVEPRDLGGILGLHVKQNLVHRNPRMVKRAFDLAAASFLLALLAPVFLLIAAVIRLTSAGPAFYGHTRFGQGGVRFKAWKFRTMFEDGDAILQQHLANVPTASREWATEHKLKSDPRLTSIGKFLRRYSLDELPQLWNVIVGEMSLVGPRPIVPNETEKYGDAFEPCTRVRPGITGLWQVSGRNDLPFRERIRLNKYYINNWSLWLDLYILSITLKTVLLGEGAY